MTCKSFIVTTYDFSNASTSAASAPSSASTVLTFLLILKYLHRQRSSVSRRCYWSSTCVKQYISSEWRVIACLRSNCMENSPLAIVSKRHQRSDTKTAWKNPLVPITSTITDINLSWGSWCLEFHHQPCCLLWKHPQDHLQRQKGRTATLRHQTLTRRSAAAVMPLLYWFCQPRHPCSQRGPLTS